MNVEEKEAKAKAAAVRENFVSLSELRDQHGEHGPITHAFMYQLNAHLETLARIGQSLNPSPTATATTQKARSAKVQPESKLSAVGILKDQTTMVAKLPLEEGIVLHFGGTVTRVPSGKDNLPLGQAFGCEIYLSAGPRVQLHCEGFSAAWRVQEAEKGVNPMFLVEKITFPYEFKYEAFMRMKSVKTDITIHLLMCNPTWKPSDADVASGYAICTRGAIEFPELQKKGKGKGKGGGKKNEGAKRRAPDGTIAAEQEKACWANCKHLFK